MVIVLLSGQILMLLSIDGNYDGIMLQRPVSLGLRFGRLNGISRDLEFAECGNNRGVLFCKTLTSQMHPRLRILYIYTYSETGQYALSRTAALFSTIEQRRAGRKRCSVFGALCCR